MSSHIAISSIPLFLLLVISAAQPSYLGCDRTIDANGAPDAACGTSTDVLQCSTIMGAAPVTGTFLSGPLPSCVLPGETVQLSFGSDLNVFHADIGTVTNENKCSTKSQSILQSTTGFSSAEWTAPGNDGNATFLMLFAGGFQQVTMQEATLQVSAACSAAPSTSPSLSPTTFTRSPSASPTVFSQASSFSLSSALLGVMMAISLLFSR